MAMFSSYSPSVVSSALRAEWQLAINRLPAAWRERFSPPVILLVPELSGKWGQWHGGRAPRIELKESLLTRHPWFALVDVLRHETAHQVVETLFPGEDEPPHGPKFREICLLLGARPQASGTYPLLDHVLFQEEKEEGAVTPQARLLVKIRKLLSLSSSANEHEARAALLKARELEARFLEEYGETEEDAPGEEGFFTVGVGPLIRQISYRECVLASLLQEFYRVRVIWNFVPDLEAAAPGKYLKQLFLSGTRRDIQVAAYVHDCLTSYMRRALYQLSPTMLGRALGSVRIQKDFEIGVLTGFRNALREQNQRPEMRALVQWDHTRLDEHFRWAFPRLRSSQHTRTIHSPAHRTAGEEAGRRFRLKKGLEPPGARTAPPLLAP
ncbi:MAG: DUF2786 domain-containing protein [Oligosphaeraceae bacterium]